MVGDLTPGRAGSFSSFIEILIEGTLGVCRSSARTVLRLIIDEPQFQRCDERNHHAEPDAEMHRPGMRKPQHPWRGYQPEAEQEVEPFLPVRKRDDGRDRYRRDRRAAGPKVEARMSRLRRQKATATQTGKDRTLRYRNRARIGGAISSGHPPDMRFILFQAACVITTARRRKVSLRIVRLWSMRIRSMSNRAGCRGHTTAVVRRRVLAKD